jgi:hypothetical protein
LDDEGILTVENAYVRDLIDGCAFDTIYHEHVCYYSCTSLTRLMQRHGLYVNDVRHFPKMHGGSLRWYISKQRGSSPALEQLLEEEERTGVTDVSYYVGFAQQVEQLREDLLQLLHDLRRDGNRIAAYGAAAKGTVLLNYVGITTDLVEFVVDRNTHKQGRYMPGVHLPIHGPERLLDEVPDLTLLLAWNFADEIVTQQQPYVERGGRFIKPVPTPEILGGGIER